MCGAPGEHIEVEVATDHRGDGEHPLGVGAQPPDPRADHLADAVGQRHLLERSSATHRPVVVLGDRPGLGEVPQHLAHEERVAVGLAVHRCARPTAASSSV